ncbi:MAG: MFS transporter [Armatimonadota bacterium]
MSNTDNANQPAQSMKWLVLALVGTGTFMSTLDVSIVNVAMPTLTSVFKTTVATSQWFVLAYTFAITILLLTFGKLGDLLGRKRVYTCGILVFIIGSLASGLSTSAMMLIIARALQGIGSAVTMSTGPALVTEAFPPRERGKSLGLIGSAVALGLLSGPLVGGVLVQYASWRWMFFINVPVGIALVILIFAKVRGFNNRRDGRLDVLGSVLMAAALSLVLFGLTFGEDLGWSSPGTIGLLAAGAFTGWTFIMVERRAAHPVLDLSLFKNREFAVGSFAAWTNYAAIMPISVFIPFYLQSILHFQPGMVGLTLAFGPLTLAFVAPISGALSDKIGYRVLTSTGLVIVGLGTASMRSLGPHSGWLDVIWRLVLISLGSALFASPNSSSIMGSVHGRDLGIASGVVALARNLGMVSGVAIAGAIITSISHTFSLEGLRAALVASAMVGFIGAGVSSIRVGRNQSAHPRRQ